MATSAALSLKPSASRHLSPFRVLARSCWIGAISLAPALAADAAPAESHPRFTPEMEKFVENFKPGGQDLSREVATLRPSESLRRLGAADGYVVELVAHEPAVRQPIDMCFDARGRLWVVQYLQYPFPAGSTVTSYDQYLRAEFDRLSPPPPNHFRGADKISILEDKDGDGYFETDKAFIDGLNMASSVALDKDGVWILMPPYLLFYPDRNHDDKPDGDPEVHLKGFDLWDSHAIANSLTIGPDGWLYGATGSCNRLEIQGIRLLGQGIWRYHPGTRVFEIFAEGGGNTFSFEFDRQGRAFSGTNTGVRGLHYVQGGTYIKQWNKHGPALNPFSFGYFEHMEHQGFKQRFSQAFLHYEGGLFPELDGQIIVGMALTNQVQASRLLPDTSTFRTVDSVTLLAATDKSFRPVDLELGPDGAIYIADWSDPRLSHLNPRDTWEKSTGRIFRIVPRNFVRPPPVDLRNATTEQLIGHLTHANRWYREQARLQLAWRSGPIDAALTPLLSGNGDAALEALWILQLRGRLDQAQLRGLLSHRNPHVRRWSVRFLGDQNSVGEETRIALAALAARETDQETRSQLASSARRLPASQSLPIIRRLLQHDEDADDLHIPLLIWRALERQLDTGREELLAMLSDSSLWQTKLFSQHIAERLARRYTMDQGPNQFYTLKQGVYSGWQIERWPPRLQRNLETCGRLLELAPGELDVDLLIAGMAAGLTGGLVENPPEGLKRLIARLWETRPRTPALAILSARLGSTAAVTEAIAMIQQGRANQAEQQQLLDLVTSLGATSAIPVVAERLRNEKNEQIRARLLESLEGFESPAMADALIELYPSFGPRLQMITQRMLCAKPGWALVLLQRMTDRLFAPGVLSASNLTALQRHSDPQLKALLARYQQGRTDDPAERTAQELSDKGRTAYALNCAPCHQPDGQGLVQLAPSLVSSAWVRRSPAALVRIVLHGKENHTQGAGAVLARMPAQTHLDDGQIAAVLTYVRREFGNQTGAIRPAQVTKIRTATAGRSGPWSDAELAGVPE